MPVVQFELLEHPDAPYPTLVERWRHAEELGFDRVWVPDHSADYRDQEGHWFDAWVTLAAMAEATERVRIGTLVGNPILRHPVILAKQALALDHLSEGRLDVGLGTGIAGFDHAALGEPYWEPRERAARFAEFLELLDRVLRGEGGAYEGRWYRSDGVSTEPAAAQQPRPPLTLGGQSPTVLRLVARFADRWNTHGPFNTDVDEIVRVTAEQCARLDALCGDAGRSPGDVTRSLLLFGPLDPFDGGPSVAEVVDRFAPLGFTEFVLCPPHDRAALEDLALPR